MKTIFKLLISFLLLNSTLFAQVGINSSNSAPDASAGLDVNFNNKGFLPPRLTTVQRNAIGTPAEGLIIYNTDENALNMYNGMAWNSMSPVPAFVCGLTITINHLVSGGVAPVNKTVAYETLNGIPGSPTVCWITRNLGASQQATVHYDATEASAGWYFQFNRKQGYKHDGNFRTPNSAWISPINELSGWIAANDPCTQEMGTTWRLPTSTEWTNVDAGGSWTTWTDPFASVLKLHAAGALHFSGGSVEDRGFWGYYWSSTQSSATHGWLLEFYSGASSMATYSKSSGIPVRCVRDY